MRYYIFVAAMLFAYGCAKVSVEAVKPIKVDINLRVDVYQHVEKDVESIEDQIYGNKPIKVNFIFGLQSLYAQEYSQDVVDAIERRKERSKKIDEYMRKGFLGVNKNDLLQVVNPIPPGLKGSILELVNKENSDRIIIHEAVAKKNNADISDIEKVFFKDHFDRAPKGYWFEIYDIEKGKFLWVQK